VLQQRMAPKLHTLQTLLAEHFAAAPHSRAIVFVGARATAPALVHKRNETATSTAAGAIAARAAAAARLAHGRSRARGSPPQLARNKGRARPTFQATPPTTTFVFGRRHQVSALCAHLQHAARAGTCAAARPAPFVGQGARADAVGAGAAGMAQAEQLRTIQEFRAGMHNVLVATSVAEEGALC
jgi:ERCC4-related helicase